MSADVFYLLIFESARVNPSRALHAACSTRVLNLLNSLRLWKRIRSVEAIAIKRNWSQAVDARGIYDKRRSPVEQSVRFWTHLGSELSCFTVVFIAT